MPERYFSALDIDFEERGGGTCCLTCVTALMAAIWGAIGFIIPMATGYERNCCLKNLKGTCLAAYIILRVGVNLVLGGFAAYFYYEEFVTEESETTTPFSTSTDPSSTSVAPPTTGPYSPYKRARRSADGHYQDDSNQFGWAQAALAVVFLVTVYVIQRLLILWCSTWSKLTLNQQTFLPRANQPGFYEEDTTTGAEPMAPVQGEDSPDGPAAPALPEGEGAQAVPEGPALPEGEGAPLIQAVPALPEDDNALDPAGPMVEVIGENAPTTGHGPFHIYGRDGDDMESIDMSSIDLFLDRQYAEIADFDSIPNLSHGSITSSEVQEDNPTNIFSGDQLIRSFQAERDVITTEVRQSMHLLGLLCDAMDSRVRILDRRYNGPSPSSVNISLRSMNADANEDARREMEEGGREQEGGRGGRERETAEAGGAAGDHGERGTIRGEADGSTLRTTTI